MKNFLEEFRRFCAKGNVLELATGVMIGGAFSSIVNSLVNDILMPLIGLLTGGVDLSGLFVALDFQSYPSIETAQAAGVGTLNYGAFLQAGVNFLIIALCVFLAVRAMNRLMPKRQQQRRKNACAPIAVSPSMRRLSNAVGAAAALKKTGKQEAVQPSLDRLQAGVACAATAPGAMLDATAAANAAAKSAGRNSIWAFRKE